MLLFLFVGLFLLRFDARKFSVLSLFQEPPRTTRADDPPPAPSKTRFHGSRPPSNTLLPTAEQPADLVEGDSQVLVLVERQQL